MATSLTLTRSQVSAWSGYLDRRTQAGSVESLYKSNAARHFYVKLEIKTNIWQINQPIPTGEGRLSSPITTSTSNVFHLPASLSRISWQSDFFSLQPKNEKFRLEMCLKTHLFSNLWRYPTARLMYNDFGAGGASAV